MTTQKKMTASYSIMFFHFYSAHFTSLQHTGNEPLSCIYIFFTALPRTIAPAPLLRLRDNYADIIQESVYYFFFLHKWAEGCKCMYLSLTLFKGVLFTAGYVYMGQHHLTDEVSDHGLLFSPGLCFSYLIPDKKITITHSPWSLLRTEVRLHCNQSALKRKRWSLKAMASGKMDGYRASCDVCQGYCHPCL